MSSRSRLLALISALALAGCPAPATPDAGAPDTGSPDAPPSDVPTLDAPTDVPGDVSPLDAPAPLDAPTSDAPMARCGDGAVDAGEDCDDGDDAAGDGCDLCAVEPGWSCDDATPSACTEVCGDGALVGDELAPTGCDDGDTDPGDGCSPTCVVEIGYSCAGAPSACMTGCGDGVVAGTEGCDDGRLDDGDGCSSACAEEPGYDCTGAPSSCTSMCGDGVVAAGEEACDDGNEGAGDGCAACAVEAGWDCGSGTCAPICGDGLVVLGECDDMGTTPGDGCSSTCTTEPGYACIGAPSTCAPVCGDGDVIGGEACDDGNAMPGDGCASCAIETGWDCASGTCAPICGDGLPLGPEGCDDGFTQAGDGCSAACAVEADFVCTGTPSSCSFTVAYGGAAVAVPDDGAPVSVPLIASQPACIITAISTRHRWEPSHGAAGQLVLDLLGPTGIARLATRVGGASDLSGPYVFEAGGAAWPGSGSPIGAGNYAADYAPLLGQPASGIFALRVDDDAAGESGSVAELSITITCDPAPPASSPSVRTCGEILAATPTATDGTYTVDADGSGPLRPFDVYCDMTNGGWTLVLSTNASGPVSLSPAAPVLVGSARYLTAARAQALALAATQVHLRTAGMFATRSITSVAETFPIVNLRAGTFLNAGSPFRSATEAVTSVWTGPMATSGVFWHTCGPAPFTNFAPQSYNRYPDLYWAGCNGGGMHVLSDQSRWVNSGPLERIELYVR